MEFPRETSISELIYSIWLTSRPNKKFCFILGAGASKESGIPTGRDLAEKWYKEVFKNIGVEGAQKWLAEMGCSDATRLAEFYSQIYAKRFGADEQEGFETLQALMENKQPSYGYTVLSQLLTRTAHNVVITTNFDTLLEDAMYLSTDRKPIVCGHETLSSYIKPVMNRPLIVKVHRDLLLNPKSTLEQLNHLALGYEWALSRLFQYYTPIVIGYAGNDGSLMALLSKLPILSRRIFWCARGDINEKTQRLLEEQKGYLINISGFDDLMSQISLGLDLDKFNSEVIAISERKSGALAQRIAKANLDIDKSLLIKKDLEKVIMDLNPWWKYKLKAESTSSIHARRKIFEEALKELPDSPEVQASLAMYLSDIKEYENAKVAYQRAIALSPDWASAVFNYCNLLIKIHAATEEIERWFTRLFEIDPSMGEGLAGYAQYLQSKGELDKAEIYYKKSVLFGGNAAWIYGAYGCYLRDARSNNDLAERYFQEAILRDSSYPDALFCYAKLLTEFRQNHDEAEHYFKMALLAKPDYYGAMVGYAEFLANVRGNYDQAEQLFKKATQSNDVTSSGLATYAIFLRYKRLDYDRAEAFYQGAIAIQPTSADAYANYALFLSDVKSNDALAVEYFEKAISIDRNNSSLLLSYAEFLKDKRKDFKLSRQFYERSFESDGNNAKLIINYAILLYNEKEYESSERYFEKALCVHPVSSEALRIYASFLNERKFEYQRAEEYYKKAVIADPNYCVALEGYAVFLYNQGRFREAEAQIKFAVQLEKPRAKSFCVYASILSALGHEAESVRNLQRALEMDSNNSVALENLGVHYFREGDMKMAKKYFLQALDADPISTSVMINYVILLELQGAQKLADEYNEKAYAIAPDNSQVLSSMGGMFVDRKDYGKAREFLHRAIRINPQNTEAYRMLARMELMARNFKEALKYYQEGIQHSPNHEPLLREYGNFLIERSNKPELGRELVQKADTIVGAKAGA